jgi:nicotinamide-nucleotide amidase
LFAKTLTDIPGVSSVFPGGVVAYNDYSKSALLGIKPSLIKEKNAVSREVALAMAIGVRNCFNTDIGIGITGIAGPSSDNSGQIPGTVFVALVTDIKSQCDDLIIPGSRENIRNTSVSHAFNMLRNYLDEY